ncbi:involucrin-like [Hippoglossus hippoglossus]|uniref:involucrin-like n=1 Tax=Hippoglossus hippoglossus TaxID=8267 RepID=UPI00148D01E2|nr:involucrin-like [Hippoglossus hippoglossus]
MYSIRKLTCEPVLFRATDYKQLLETVKGLRDSFYKGRAMIKTVKDWAHLHESKQSKLKEELKKTHALLARETEKRRACTKAHISYLTELAQKENELKSSELKWSTKVQSLEEENLYLHEQDDLLKSRQGQLEEELKQTHQLLKGETEKRHAPTSAPVDCLTEHAQKEEPQVELDNVNLCQEQAQNEEVCITTVQKVEMESKLPTEELIESKLHPEELIESKLHPEELIESKLHPEELIESKLHPEDSIESKLHTEDRMESKLHTEDVMEEEKDRKPTRKRRRGKKGKIQGADLPLTKP